MEQNFEPEVLVRRFSQAVALNVDRGNTTSDLERLVAKDVRLQEQREREDAKWRLWFDPYAPADEG